MVGSSILATPFGALSLLVTRVGLSGEPVNKIEAPSPKAHALVNFDMFLSGSRSPQILICILASAVQPETRSVI